MFETHWHFVTACIAQKWNPPSCADDCPVCYNGGVCDDVSGQCICAPGFSGTVCEKGKQNVQAMIKSCLKA